MARGQRPDSALEIALLTRHHALVQLLLCNGYDPNLDRCSPLDLALRARRWDLLDLLLEWGADPHRVDLTDLFGTYRSELFERFFALGVELTASHELGSALAYHSSNKPLFGFAKRHRERDPKLQKELNIALVHHVDEGNEKGVQLCLWAGADPHAPAPDLRFPSDMNEADSEMDPQNRFVGFTAVEQACRRGHAAILKRLHPDPSRDDFDELYGAASSGAITEALGRVALPMNVGAVIRSQMFWLHGPIFERRRSTEPLRYLFEVGARWETSTLQEIADVRRELLRMPEDTFIDVMSLLATKDYCSPDTLHDLGRTRAMRARIAKVGFMPAAANDPRRFDRPRPPHARDVLSKFGVMPPKFDRRLPPSVWIGSPRAATQRITLTRNALYDRVWSEPVERLARTWGLSGRGLAKVCRRLQVPVPPRGFWAKARHGQRARRPPLPALQPGEAEEIVVHVRDSGDDPG
jgi:hypothetical protein